MLIGFATEKEGLLRKIAKLTKENDELRHKITIAEIAETTKVLNTLSIYIYKGKAKSPTNLNQNSPTALHKKLLSEANAKRFVNESVSKSKCARPKMNVASPGNKSMAQYSKSRSNKLNILNKTSEECLTKGELMISPTDHIREQDDKLKENQTFMIAQPITTPRNMADKLKPSKSECKESASKIKSTKVKKGREIIKM